MLELQMASFSDTPAEIFSTNATKLSNSSATTGLATATAASGSTCREKDFRWQSWDRPVRHRFVEGRLQRLLGGLLGGYPEEPWNVGRLPPGAYLG